MIFTILITDDTEFSRAIPQDPFEENDKLFGDVEFQSYNGNAVAWADVSGDRALPSGIVADNNTQDGLMGFQLLKNVAELYTERNLPHIPMAILTGDYNTVLIENELKSTPRTTVFRREYRDGELDLMAVWFYMQFHADTLKDEDIKQELYGLKRVDIIHFLGGQISEVGEIMDKNVFRGKISELIQRLHDDTQAQTEFLTEKLRESMNQRLKEGQMQSSIERK